jgi:hypothetical protein
MDNGEVIPGLDEGWSFAGAKAFEWLSGAAVLLILTETVDSIPRAMPLLFASMLGTTLGLAALRRLFPDEERGLRNKLMTMIGMVPPGIPACARLQPVWSGAPIRTLKATKQFEVLELEAALAVQVDEIPGEMLRMAGAFEKKEREDAANSNAINSKEGKAAVVSGVDSEQKVERT